jgi:hypothetical protein
MGLGLCGNRYPLFSDGLNQSMELIYEFITADMPELVVVQWKFILLEKVIHKKTSVSKSAKRIFWGDRFKRNYAMS